MSIRRAAQARHFASYRPPAVRLGCPLLHVGTKETLKAEGMKYGMFFRKDGYV